MRSRLAFALLYAAALLVPTLHATVIVPAEFREVVAGSELIAYGRVIDVHPEWADGRRRIDSVVTIDVLSWFKGGNDSMLSFVVPGGEIGRYRQVMVGAPVFKPGDEAFVFLKTRGSVRPYVFGLNQGVFRVRADERGVPKVTSPALLATGTAPEVVRRGAVTRQPMAVDAFGAEIRTVMAAGRSGAR
jgi:hypothetical protein